MATAGAWSDTLSRTVHRALTDRLRFPAMTPVQAASLPHAVGQRRHDLVVQAETGSGKTLAYLVPLAELLLRVVPSEPTHTVALVLVPTRELAKQVLGVARTLLAAIGLTYAPALLTGGSGSGDGGGEEEREREKRQVRRGDDSEDSASALRSAPRALPSLPAERRVIIGTPGRVEHAGLHRLRDLELLVLDEADRLLDLGFRIALSNILDMLPKQRQTFLFSATQTRDTKDLVRVGMRSPVHVTVRRKQRQQRRQGQRQRAGGAANGEAASDSRASTAPTVPRALATHYVIVRQEQKLALLMDLLRRRRRRGEKTIVYFLTCAFVDFLQAALQPDRRAGPAGNEESGRRASQQRHLQRNASENQTAPMERGGRRVVDEPDTCTSPQSPLASPMHDRDVYFLHGKMVQRRRSRTLDAFRRAAATSTPTASAPVLFTTDVASRGLDFDDVRLIVQFDPPQNPDTYLHRIGRTARIGRSGDAILLLTPEESAYPDFLRARRCPAAALDWASTDAAATAGGGGGGGGGGGADARDDAGVGCAPRAEGCGDYNANVNNNVDTSSNGCGGDEENQSRYADTAVAATPAVSSPLSRVALAAPTTADDAASGDLIDERRLRALRTYLVRAQLADRAVMERAENAFLSYLRAYKEHHCNLVLRFDKFDIAALATQMALLRMPRFNEAKRRARALATWQPPSARDAQDAGDGSGSVGDYSNGGGGIAEAAEGIDVTQIAYRDRVRERARQRRLVERAQRRRSDTGGDAAVSRGAKRDGAQRRDPKRGAHRARHQPCADADPDAEYTHRGDADDSEADMLEEYRQMRKRKRRGDRAARREAHGDGSEADA